MNPNNLFNQRSSISTDLQALLLHVMILAYLIQLLNGMILAYLIQFSLSSVPASQVISCMFAAMILEEIFIDTPQVAPHSPDNPQVCRVESPSTDTNPVIS